MLLVCLLTFSLACAQSSKPAAPFVSYKVGKENIHFLINHDPLVVRRSSDLHRTPLMNILGYEVLKGKEIPKSFVVFVLNVRENRDKSNTYDSPGDGYLTVVDEIMAMADFEKAIELDLGKEADKFKLIDPTKIGLDESM